MEPPPGTTSSICITSVVNLTDTSQCIQPFYSLRQVPNLLLHYRGGSGGSLPPAPPPRYVSLTVVNLTDTSQCIQSFHSLQQVPNLLLHYRGGSGGSLPPAPPATKKISHGPLLSCSDTARQTRPGPCRARGPHPVLYCTMTFPTVQYSMYCTVLRSAVQYCTTTIFDSTENCTHLMPPPQQYIK